MAQAARAAAPSARSGLCRAAAVARSGHRGGRHRRPVFAPRGPGLTPWPGFPRPSKEVWQKPGEQVLYVRASLPEEPLPSGSARAGYGLHPALLDAVLHALFVQRAARSTRDRSFCPLAGPTSLHAREATELRVALRVEEVQGERARLAVTAVDGDGQPVLQVAGLELRRANAQRLRSIGRASASSSSLSALRARARRGALAEGRLESTTVIGTGPVSAAWATRCE